MTPLFLIQSHKNPAQIARLVRVLREGCPNSVVLVSHDFRVSDLPAAMTREDASVHVIEGRGGRGDFEIVDAYLAALRWLRDNRIEYDWVTNLSGQDYPVASLSGFTADLLRARHDGYLHHFDALIQDSREMTPMAWPAGHGRDRYLYQYRKIKQTFGKAERAAFRIPRIVIERMSDRYRFNTAYGLLAGRRAGVTPFSETFRCYAGSYWHTVRRRCADYLIDFTGAHPEVVTYLRGVLVPDECFVQTILANNPDFHFVNDNRRYYDMSGSRLGHPKVMTEDDLPQFIGKNYVFARKFEPDSRPRLFDTLDRLALGKPASAGRERLQADALS